MNNGCYGLTKGQDSATADNGSKNKHGQVNPFESIDLASLAIELGATFVAQSFSGDKTQLIPLMKAAIKHPGFAFINVISPCVTFNNNVGSTKSYDYVREHIEATSTMDFVPEMAEITTSYEEGSLKKVKMHDGSFISLNKLSKEWDPLDKRSAVNAMMNAKARGEILTGLLYMNPETTDLHHTLDTNTKPLNTLTKKDLCPGAGILKDINAELR
ncbi:MAG TPA: thiamine pyrophosphate-dependent enzyme, partial [Bacteroidia bacterium]|nr:thiamine pyrophosphate-dependent enzyme [Bacteroidia bacterium]